MRKKTTWWLLLILAAALFILTFYITMRVRKADHERPVISMESPTVTVSVKDPQDSLLAGVTAWDKADGDVTDSLLIESIYGIGPEGDATVTYAAFDGSGNVSKAQRTVHYTDYVSPRFTLSGPLVYEFGKGFDVLDSVDAWDIFEGEINSRIRTAMLTSGTSVTEEGIHDVQFSVTNSMGDTTQLILPVEVYPTGTYNAQVALSEYLIYLPTGSDFTPEDYLRQLHMPSETVNLRYRVPDTVKVRISGSADTGRPGIYPISYTVTCETGNVTYTGYTRLFVVVEG